eukprot:1450608-Pyramimonas_sp.AAC.1
MLRAETNTAVAASHWAGPSGTRPPSIMSRPPTAVMPLMALVTDIRGECSAGVTPHTTCKAEPTKNAVTITDEL